MKGKIIADWGKVDFRSAEGRKKLYGAFNHYMAQPLRDEKFRSAVKKIQAYGAMQHFATKGDFPDEILQVIEKFHEAPNYDLGYESIFDIRDYTGTNEGGFDILNVASGLTFAKVPTGGKAKVEKFSGTKARVSFDKYGAALEWDRTLIEDRQYWTMEDTMSEFRNKAFSSRAQAFYDMIDAVSSAANVAWSAVTPASVATSNENYDAIRDVNTMNDAGISILRALKDKGYGITANTPLVILAPIELRSRLLRANSMIQQAVAGSEKRANFSFVFVWTLMLSATDKYYVIYPKGKLKGGYRLNLTLLGDVDVLAYADLMAGWQRYGGAIGDTDQVRRCSIA